MAGFTPAFEMDDSTILFRLHKAAEENAKKVGAARKGAWIINTGIVNDDPKASFKRKDFKYFLQVGKKINLQIFNGATSFIVDTYYQFDEKTLKKLLGNKPFSAPEDSGNISQLKNFRKEVFETMQTYFKTFSDQQQVKKLQEQDLKLYIDYNIKKLFDGDKAVDDEAKVSFVVQYTIGATTPES